MTAEQFTEYLAIYCRITGASAGARETLAANYKSFVLAWRMSGAELGEVAYRIVQSGAIPNWPNEHLAAVKRELDAHRAEKLAAARPKRDANECRVCDGKGLVTVPHPCCVYQGRVTGYYDAKNRIRRRDVVTIAVICTAPKCYAGQAALASNRRWADEANKPKLLTMDNYSKRIGVHVEPVTILREWEAQQAYLSRLAEPPDAKGQDFFRGIIGNILARQEAWAEQPYRDDAEVDAEEAMPA